MLYILLSPASTLWSDPTELKVEYTSTVYTEFFHLPTVHKHLCMWSICDRLFFGLVYVHNFPFLFWNFVLVIQRLLFWQLFQLQAIPIYTDSVNIVKSKNDNSFLKIVFLIGCWVFGWNDEMRRTDPAVLRKGSLPRFATMIWQKDLLYYIYILRTGAFWM